MAIISTDDRRLASDVMAARRAGARRRALVRIVGIVVLVACKGESKVATPRERDAALPVAVPDGSTPSSPITTTLATGAKSTLGDLEIELISTGGGTGDGVAVALYSLAVRRGSDEVRHTLSAASGGGVYGDHDLDAEIVAFDQLLVIDAPERGPMTITRLSGAAPTARSDEEAEALIAAEAAASQRILGDPAPRLRAKVSANPGMYERTAFRGEARLWTAKVRRYTGTVQFRTPPVHPAALAGGVKLIEGKAVSLPGGFRAKLTYGGHGMHATRGPVSDAVVTIAKGGRSEDVALTAAARFDGEFVAFGRLFVIDDEQIVVKAGKPPAEVGYDEARRLVETAAQDAGWPMKKWRAGSVVVGMGGFGATPGIKQLDGGDWTGRVGRYTRRVWISER